jgi:hypothetical protein
MLGLVPDDPAATPIDLPDYARRPDPTYPPERLLRVIRRVEDGGYLLIHHDDQSPPVMLSTAPPHRDEGFDAGIASLVHARLGVRVARKLQSASEIHPVRMLHPYTGGGRPGHLRAVAVEVTGEVVPDALVASVESLDADEAWAALATDLERAIFRDGVDLLG